MKSYKFEVVLLNEDGTVKESKQFKSYKEISESLNIAYHLVRDINQISDGVMTKKFYHTQLNELLNKLKIHTVKSEIKLEFLNN